MKKFNQAMPKWKASIISGLVIAAGFYASADLEARNNKLYQVKAVPETTKQIYRINADSTTKVGNSIRASNGRNEQGQ